MKKYMFSFFILGLLILNDCLSQIEYISINEQSISKIKPVESFRKCGAYEHYVTTNIDQNVRQRRMNIERDIRTFLMNSTNRQTTGICRIPVVFHIVMDDPNDVTDGQVQTQLDVLNQDFRAFSLNLPWPM